MNTHTLPHHAESCACNPAHHGHGFSNLPSVGRHRRSAAGVTPLSRLPKNLNTDTQPRHRRFRGRHAFPGAAASQGAVPSAPETRVCRSHLPELRLGPLQPHHACLHQRRSPRAPANHQPAFHAHATPLYKGRREASAREPQFHRQSCQPSRAQTTIVLHHRLPPLSVRPFGPTPAPRTSSQNASTVAP